MKKPSTLYVMPVEEAAEGDSLLEILFNGSETCPSVGGIAILIPVDRAVKMRVVSAVYKITRTRETGLRDWPWSLKFSRKVVPTPRTWYEITDSILEEGLVPILGTPGGAIRLTDFATIAHIWDLLGFHKQPRQKV